MITGTKAREEVLLVVALLLDCKELFGYIWMEEGSDRYLGGAWLCREEAALDDVVLVLNGMRSRDTDVGGDGGE